ncbi:ABC transporter HlyB/MsbA family protein [Calothrix parasitica NIES-267]|uniref:ABC transporter HlyB/MsbA family protein n=1 Tax=Calothrix parasitica NIES-267 TaxID=1973488 RepID=A0A1Z4LTD8_9CYAN|nr:ABC transporter HlyB/MsbA family protein [Calothrix parasitica NIES-267]
MTNNIFDLAAQRKSLFIRGIVLQVISSIFAAAPYFFVYIILKELFEKSIDIERALLLTGATALCLVLQGIFLYLANSLTFVNGTQMIGDLRLQLGDGIRKLPMGFFNSRQVGDLNVLMTDDMCKIEDVPSVVYPKIVSALATPIFIAVFLFLIDWRLALATIAGFPIAIAIYFSSQKLLNKLTKLQKKSLVEANSRMIEYIQGLPVLKAFNQTGARFEKLENALDSYKQANLNLVNQLATPSIAFSGFLELGFVVIIIVGTYTIFGGEITTSTFLLFLVVGLRFYEPLSGLFELSGMTRMMDVALERVIDILKEPQLPEPTESHQLSSFDIEFKNVDFSYEEFNVLQSINFQVPQNTVTALVGPSGSGKTTITNLIARFWEVDKGEILIGGVNIKNIKIDELLSKISIVFQDVYLFNDTILNNIKFGKPDSTFEEVISATQAAQCHEFITNLPDGYETVIGEGGTSLSGGEKQRVSIARAILKDAPIILLDEATASVDPENEILIQKAINSLVESRTLIIIAHRLSTITSVDQIIVIDNGKVIEKGKHEELTRNTDGLYNRLWNSQQKARQWKLNIE